jgi:glycerol kinase
MLATVGAGLYSNLDTAGAAMGGDVTTFVPQMGAAERERRLAGWRDALARI